MNKLILLGTGAATSLSRQMTSILFSIGSRGVLIDCGDGMGTVRSITKSGIRLDRINDVFLTHKHADHISGLSQFLLLKMMHEDNPKVRIFGNIQTLNTAKRFVFETHDFLRDKKDLIAFIPIIRNQPVILYRQISVRGVQVSGRRGKQALCLGYALEFEGKKISYSADMSPNAGFNKLADGSDVMIHECFGVDRDKAMIHSYGHSTAKDAAITAQSCRAKNLILTHLRDEPTVSYAEIENEARKYYSGKLTLAHDMMETVL